jgi:hypothetical protein
VTTPTPAAGPKAALLRWLEQHGARFPGCAPVEVPGMGTGLVASRDLAVDDTVLSIPRNLWFTRKSRHVRYAPVLTYALEKELFSHSMARLALLLLLERQDPKSFFRPYLDALPDPTLPVTLTPAEQAELQEPQLGEWIEEQGTTVRTDCTRLREALPARFPESIRADTITPETWLWAYGHAVQRTFSVDLEGEEVWVLLPGMDLCNHASSPQTGYFVDDAGWQLEATEAIPAGAPVTISYGPTKNSADFFLYYGFVPEDNPNDRVRLQLRLDPADRDHADKQAAVEVLGLDTECYVAEDGVIPTSFLNAVVLWSLDHETFATGGKDFQSPEFDAPAYLHLARTLEGRLSEFATTLAADEQQLEHVGFAGWRRHLILYRIAYKRLLRDAAAAMRRHANRRVVGVATRAQRLADEDTARYALFDVPVPVGDARREVRP